MARSTAVRESADDGPWLPWTVPGKSDSVEIDQQIRKRRSISALVFGWSER
jgi:hypothetical protein